MYIYIYYLVYNIKYISNCTNGRVVVSYSWYYNNMILINVHYIIYILHVMARKISPTNRTVKTVSGLETSIRLRLDAIKRLNWPPFIR